MHGGCRVAADPRHAAEKGQSGVDSYGGSVADRVFDGDFGGKLSEVPGFSLRERDQGNGTLYPLVN